MASIGAADIRPVYHNVPPTSRLRELLTLEREDLWIAVIYSVAIGVLTLAVPAATQSLVNTVAFGNMLQPLVVLALLVLLGLSFSTVLQSLRIYVVELVQRRVFVRISSTVTKRLLTARPDVFDRYHGPELVNRFFDVVTLQKSGAMLLIDGLSVAMQTVIGMVLLALYHPWLLAFDFILLAIILVVLFPVGRGAVNTAIEESKAKYKVAAWLEEVARFPTTFKTASGTQYAEDRANDLVGGYLDNRKRHFRILMRQIVGFLGLQAFALAGLLGAGGWLVIERQLTLGQLIAAELVVALIVTGVSKLGKHLELFYDLLAAVDKVGYLTDLPEERTDGEMLPNTGTPAPLELRDVSFSTARRTLFDHMSLTIEGGRRIGLLASRGRGKSTLLETIAALKQPDSGSVLVDGLDVREIAKAELRGQVMLVDEIEIFDGTILDNVVMSQSGSRREARSAIDAVGLTDELAALPDGLDTRLSTGGAPLSFRQTTRLAIARAIVARPRMLLVDETLDRLGELDESDPIVDAIFGPDAPWTLLIITARSSLLNRCDGVYELVDGSLTEVPRT